MYLVGVLYLRHFVFCMHAAFFMHDVLSDRGLLVSMYTIAMCLNSVFSLFSRTSHLLSALLLSLSVTLLPAIECFMCPTMLLQIIEQIFMVSSSTKLT